MKKIIGIHGLMGHGKDTLGAALADAFRTQDGYNVYNQRFAFTVKQNVSNLTGIPLQIVDEKSYDVPVWDFTREQKAEYLEKWGMTLGRMLQIYATEGVRDALHPSAWIFALEAKIESSDTIGKNVYIITDLRFPNEIDWIKQNGGVCIKIKRPDANSTEGRDMSHASEAGLPDELFNIIIDNDRSLDDLIVEAEKTASRLSLFPEDV